MTVCEDWPVVLPVRRLTSDSLILTRILLAVFFFSSRELSSSVVFDSIANFSSESPTTPCNRASFLSKMINWES